MLWRLLLFFMPLDRNSFVLLPPAGHLQAVREQVQGPEQVGHEEVRQRRQPGRRPAVPGRAVLSPRRRRVFL